MADAEAHTDEIAPGHVAIARIIGAHGVHGDCKIEPLAPEPCFQPGTEVLLNGERREIERLRRGAKHPLLKLSGIDNREAASELRGSYIQVAEDSLPPLAKGEYYRFQLIGLAVQTGDGDDLGRITEVISTGANDAYAIDGPRGTFLIPATSEVVRNVDLKSNTMTITPLPGLLPDA